MAFANIRLIVKRDVKLLLKGKSDSITSVLNSFARQTETLSWEVKDNCQWVKFIVDTGKTRTDWQDIVWKSLIDFCRESNVTVVNENDFVILTDIAEILPQILLFSLKFLKTLPCLNLKGIANFLKTSYSIY